MLKSHPISAVCTICGREFIGSDKRADDVILQIKAEFREHSCKDAQAGKTDGGNQRWIY